MRPHGGILNKSGIILCVVAQAAAVSYFSGKPPLLHNSFLAYFE